MSLDFLGDLCFTVGLALVVGAVSIWLWQAGPLPAKILGGAVLCLGLGAMFAKMSEKG